MEQTKLVQALGNIPAIRNTYFTADVPEVKLEAGQRLAVLRYKTDKETKTKREAMAVVVNQHTPGNIIRGCEKGTEFLQVLVDEVQDQFLKLVADGKADFDVAQDYQKLVADYLDNTRAGGNRVTAETVGKMFDAGISDWLMGRVMVKFPAFDADKVAAVVLQYRASFCDLAKYQMPHSKQVSAMLSKAWGEFVADAETPELPEGMAEWVSARLKKLHDRHNAVEMLVDAI